MYGYESSTINNAEHQRIDSFELWCWKRLLRLLWTERTSNQSMLKEIISNVHLKYWCWSWSSSTLFTWCEEPTHWKRPRWRERLKAKEKRLQRMRWLHRWSPTHSMNMNLSKFWEIVEGRRAWRAAIYGVPNSQTWLSYWTTATIKVALCPYFSNVLFLYLNSIIIR